MSPWTNHGPECYGYTIDQNLIYAANIEIKYALKTEQNSN
jgi:hypothetical protein